MKTRKFVFGVAARTTIHKRDAHTGHPTGARLSWIKQIQTQVTYPVLDCVLVLVALELTNSPANHPVTLRIEVNIGVTSLGLVAARISPHVTG